MIANFCGHNYPENFSLLTTSYSKQGNINNILRDHMYCWQQLRYAV